MFYRRNLTNSLRCAINGLSYTYHNQQNFKIHVLAGLCVIILSSYLNIKLIEWIVLILVMATVLVLELINSILEIVIDLIEPKMHNYVRVIKDVFAGCVLIFSMASIIIGFLIFIPYLK